MTRGRFEGLYQNNLKNREFGEEAPQNFQAQAMWSERPLPSRQGASEHENFEEKPTLPKTDSSGCFGIAFTSTAANGDEHQQVEPLLDRVQSHIGSLQQRLGTIPIFEADKGYDAAQLRNKLLKRIIFPWICRRKKPGGVFEKVESALKRMRWKVERAISWLQRKFRRLAVRWESRTRYWKGFLAFGLIVFWIDRLVR